MSGETGKPEENGKEWAAPEMPAGRSYLQAAREILDRIESTQMPALAEAARLCADCILNDGLVHLFGSGHSRIPVEEMFPRYGSFPGFHPIVELSITYHNQVVGANGQRQALWIERQEGLGPVILRNFTFGPRDCMIVFSSSGLNAVSVDVALEAKRLGMPVIGVTSMAHSRASEARHSSGKRLFEVCDLVIDNCAVAGDAMVDVPGLDYPVGPGSTIGGAAVVNILKCEIARLLTEAGKPPTVLTAAYFMGDEASKAQIERVYDEYRERTRRL
jgi:uncharacterized phosphosugar-binding protein